MINQYELPALLINELPGIEQELKAISPTLNVFKTVLCLANYTKNSIQLHDLDVVRKCFGIAADIYLKGNSMVKNAIENVFVFSLALLMNKVNCDEKKQLQAIVPLDLHNAYVQQLLKTGI